nr:reverse transcriptase [Tanacetum cinerariifolium]GEV47655.1 reverse transcriptase [Tanacetum cinerariifolium]
MQIQEETARSFDDKLHLKQLLSTYEDVFAMPTVLPPPRAHDHTITLLPNTPPATDPLKIQAMASWPIPKTLKWRGYLLDRHFKIKTDHFSLKYLLDQRLTIPFQTKWLPKLLGCDYEISYKKGAKNGVADALSRKGKLVVRDVPELKEYLFNYVHATSIGGHSGVQVTLLNLKAMVYQKAFEAVYGQLLPTYVPYESRDSHVESVDSQLHNVSHVSQLKECTHPMEASGVLPAVDSEGLLPKTPAAILDRRLGKVRNSPMMYVLVQWIGC